MDHSSFEAEEYSTIIEGKSSVWNRLKYIHGPAVATWAKENILLLLMLVGVTLGFVVGAIVGSHDPSETAVRLIGFPGELLLRMLKAMVLPLVAASLIIATANLGRSKDAGSGTLFKSVLFYFGGTTILAVILGILLVTAMQPGARAGLSPIIPVDSSSSDEPAKNVTVLDSILGVFESLVPDNLIKAAYNMDILGIVSFSLVLGSVLGRMGEDADPLYNAISSLNDAVMKIVMLVMWYAPIGIFSLIAARLAGNPDFWKVLGDLAFFAATVMAGLSIHLFVILPAIYVLFVRKNPFTQVYSKMGQAIITAIGTDSSSATLPVSMRCLEGNVGIDPMVVHIVLPLGTTMNMNGTALYEAVAAIFIAQLHGINLSVAEIIIVALTATLAAIGAAGIPEAGIVTLTLVLTSVGLPLSDIGLLLTIDWFLDRCRTVVNVLGDCVGACIVDHLENKRKHTR